METTINLVPKVANDFMATPDRWLGPDTGAGRKQLTPAELEAFAPKPKPAVPAPRSLEQEASALVYRCGIRELGPFFFRCLTMEATVREQAVQIAALQQTVLKLKHGK